MQSVKAAVIFAVLVAFVCGPDLVWSANSSPVGGQGSPDTGQRKSHVPDEIIVKFRQGVAEKLEQRSEARAGLEADGGSAFGGSRSLDRLNARHGVRQIKPVIEDFRKRHTGVESARPKAGKRADVVPSDREQRISRRLTRAPKDAKRRELDRIYRIKFDPPPAGESIEQILEQYRSDPNVEYAELNHIVRICRTPNDAQYGSLWSLEKIAAPQAWDISVGNTDVIVAVIDTGVDYNHRDIRANMWVNQAERDGQPGIDDDENGYVDDIYGYDFIYNRSDPMDDHGHGTHCAGIIAAVGDNGLDVAGVCWKARIMALKFIGSLGEGTTADVVPAIYYAVANGAEVLSNSWGGDEESNLLRETIEYAQSEGVIVVAAAGNNGTDDLTYPAAFANVISVAATTGTDERWSVSSYGDWVDIAAPGYYIRSLRAAGTSEGSPDSKYLTTMSGTSMACPHVAGACALMLVANPYLKLPEIYKILTETADPIKPGTCWSNGRLNVGKAMGAVVPAKGYLTFSKAYYNSSSEILLLLADWNLKATGRSQVTLYTDRGDNESLVLSESRDAFGIFTGVMNTSLGEPNVGDGRLQVGHDQAVAAMYFDANDGSREPAAVIADAVIDDKPPGILHIDVQTKGPTADIVVLTGEVTTAQIRGGATCGGPYTFSAKSTRQTVYHTFRLRPLAINTEYFYAIDLTDQAGNSVTIDKDGSCYSFKTDAEFPGFLVPGVFATIQEAIDAASDGDVVWVADGVYSGDGNVEMSFKGKAIAVRSENGPEHCIIDCRTEGRAFHFSEGEDGNSVLDGFTIKNASGGTAGGAIRCTASSPTIANCVFVSNVADDYGAAIHNSYGSSPTIRNCTFKYNHTQSCGCVLGNGGAISNVVNSSPEIIDCTFIANRADYGGGAIYNYKLCNPRIINCLFSGNSAGDQEKDRGFGGAVFNSRSNPVITGCRFERNTSGKDAGGVYNSDDSVPIITQCIFVENRAVALGGAIKGFGAGAKITNCTIAYNQAESGPALWNGPSDQVELTNCIVWGNADANERPIPQIFNLRDTYKVSANYCCIQDSSADGGFEGVGNINAEPIFVDANKGDYHLQSAGWRWDMERRRWHYDSQTSPCIDTGNPGQALGGEPLSVADDPNNIWAVNVRIDMGAYGGTAEASLAPRNWALLADIDNDGAVNFHDFAVQLQLWLEVGERSFADLDRSGVVDTCDLELLSSEWLRHVRPPVVEITSPADGALFTIWPIEIEIRAKASDVDGFVAKVEFLANGKVFGEDTNGADGWSAIFRHDVGGDFQITARAIDNGGSVATSKPIRLQVIPPRQVN